MPIIHWCTYRAFVYVWMMLKSCRQYYSKCEGVLSSIMYTSAIHKLSCALCVTSTESTDPGCCNARLTYVLQDVWLHRVSVPPQVYRSYYRGNGHPKATLNSYRPQQELRSSRKLYGNIMYIRQYNTLFGNQKPSGAMEDTGFSKCQKRLTVTKL